MTKKIIDLHTHTTASDGILSPTELVKKAKEVGLSAIGIADHDQVAGIDEAIEAGDKCGIEVVPSVELSTYWIEKNRKEFHVLGYYIDWKNKIVLDKLRYFNEEREKRGESSLAVFEELGYAIDRVFFRSIVDGAIARPHIARTILENPKNAELLKKNLGEGYDWQGFFNAYLVPGKPAYREKIGFDPKGVIDFVHDHQGVAVLAHPGWDVAIGDEETLDYFRDLGIDGLEAIAYTETVERSKICIPYFTEYAQKNNLLITGGSDFHGREGNLEGLGMVEWGIEVDYRYLEKLKKYQENR